LQIEESVLVDFSPQNAAFLHDVYPKLPAILRQNLTRQLQASLIEANPRGTGTGDKRLLATYRILR